MTTASRSFTEQVWIEGGAASWTTLSGTNEEFSDAIDLTANGEVGADILVEVDFDATPTDDVDINLYKSLDGSNWDDIATSSVRLDNGTDPSQITIQVEGGCYWRVGFQQTGATDSHNVRASWIGWTIDIS